MIFPYPYVRGSKRYPILGYHEDVYALNQSHIGMNLNGIDGNAYIMDGRSISIEEENHILSIGAPDDPYITCNWDELFNEPYGNNIAGHYYVLLPKSSMKYPTMDQVSAVWGGAVIWRPFTPLDVDPTDIIFTSDDDFTTTSTFAGGEGEWQLVVMKGPWDRTLPLELTNWLMRAK